MPRLIPTNPVAAGLFAYTMWRKLPPAQRRLLLDAARTHGPRVAAAAAAAAKARKKRLSSRTQWGVRQRSTGNDRCRIPHSRSIAVVRRLTTTLCGSTLRDAALENAERDAHDAILLALVGGRIALARRGAPRASDVRDARHRRSSSGLRRRAGAGSSATRPCSGAPPAPRRSPRAGAGRRSARRRPRPGTGRAARAGPRRQWWRRRARRGRRCRSRPCRCRGRAGARRLPRRGRESPGETSRSRDPSSVDDACLRRRRPFGVITTSGRAVASSAWRRSRWKNWAAVVQFAIRMLSCAPCWRNRSSRALECSGPLPS